MLNTEYPGAHACVSTAAAHALRRFFRSDDTMFPMDGIVNGVTYVHTFNRYTDAGAEARAARIYGGLHYEFSNEASARLGRQIVRQMFDRGFFRRVRNQTSDDHHRGCRRWLSEDVATALSRTASPPSISQ